MTKCKNKECLSTTNMAEPEDDKLESIAVVSENNLPSAAAVDSDVQEENHENVEAISNSSVQKDDEKVKLGSVNLDDISVSEYTDDDGDDEDDDDGVFKDNKKKIKRLKKKKPKHVAIDDDTSSDEDENPEVNPNINPVFDTFFLKCSSPPPPDNVEKIVHLCKWQGGGLVS